MTAGQVLGGVEPVLAAVAGRLEQTVPDELDRLDVVYGRPVAAPDPDDGPDLWRRPQLVARADRAIIEPDDYPALLVVPQNTDQAYAVDVADGAVVWRIPYRVRIWAFCRHYGADNVSACRNRLAVAVLQSLLRAPRLSELMAIDPNGWRQSWSDTGVDERDQSTVAGWWVEVIVNSTETVTLDPVAAADVIAVVVHPEAD